MAACGICLFGFTLAQFADVLFPMLHHPLASAQEVSSGVLILGFFLGGPAAVRRDTNFRIGAISDKWTGAPRLIAEVVKRTVMLGVAGVMTVFGYVNFLHGFGRYMTPSETPIAVLYAALPVAGVLIGLFVVEGLICRLRNGVDSGELTDVERTIAAGTAMDQPLP